MFQRQEGLSAGVSEWIPSNCTKKPLRAMQVRDTSDFLSSNEKERERAELDAGRRAAASLFPVQGGSCLGGIMPGGAQEKC